MFALLSKAMQEDDDDDDDTIPPLNISIPPMNVAYVLQESASGPKEDEVEEAARLIKEIQECDLQVEQMKEGQSSPPQFTLADDDDDEL